MLIWEAMSDSVEDVVMMTVQLGRSKVTNERHSFNGSP